MGRLDGKVVLITGAGSGMGRLAAVLCAREGARIVAADVVESAGQETTAQVRASGGEAMFALADVSRAAEVAAAVRAGETAFGRLDVLYNNAGIFPAEDGSVIDLDEAVWDRVMNVNLTAIYLASDESVWTNGAVMVVDGGITSNDF